MKRECREEDHLRIVRKMGELQSQRGPDDDGVVSLGHVCLGSNRLSIIDLSHAGHMPMSDASENVWIVYNGETYNFQPLRDELIGAGTCFGRKPTPKWFYMHSSSGAKTASRALPACLRLPSMTSAKTKLLSSVIDSGKNPSTIRMILITYCSLRVESPPTGDGRSKSTGND